MDSKKPKTDLIPTAFEKAKILIADDEHLVATGLASAVREIGHNVVGIAGDGETAIQMARKHQPDLALLDIRMPKHTGIEVARVLQEELNIPSLIVSAYSDKEYVAQIQGAGLSSGVFGYVLKPVGLDELRVTLGVALHQSAAAGYRTGRIDQLENNLANRRTVEQAKWKMVKSMGITEPEAHDKLQRMARDKRKPLIDVARGVLEDESAAAVTKV
ncbi:MAG: response regulator [Phycisphaerales bacterium]|nr:response regulator [Phycisphaerales bacterium]